MGVACLAPGLARQPQDHVAVALAWATQITQLVDDTRLKPNLALALVVHLGLEGRADRQRRLDRLLSRSHNELDTGRLVAQHSNQREQPC
jgi:hypothetical protein